MTQVIEETYDLSVGWSEWQIDRTESGDKLGGWYTIGGETIIEFAHGDRQLYEKSHALLEQVLQMNKSELESFLKTTPSWVPDRLRQWMEHLRDEWDLNYGEYQHEVRSLERDYSKVDTTTQWD